MYKLICNRSALKFVEQLFQLEGGCEVALKATLSVVSVGTEDL